MSYHIDGSSHHIDCACWATGKFVQVPCPFHDGCGQFPHGAYSDFQVRRIAELETQVRAAEESGIRKGWDLDTANADILKALIRVGELEKKVKKACTLLDAARRIAPKLRCTCPRTAHDTPILSATCPVCDFMAALKGADPLIEDSPPEPTYTCEESPYLRCPVHNETNYMKRHLGTEAQ